MKEECWEKEPQMSLAVPGTSSRPDLSIPLEQPHFSETVNLKRPYVKIERHSYVEKRSIHQEVSCANQLRPYVRMERFDYVKKRKIRHEILDDVCGVCRVRLCLAVIKSIPEELCDYASDPDKKQVVQYYITGKCNHLAPIDDTIEELKLFYIYGEFYDKEEDRIKLIRQSICSIRINNVNRLEVDGSKGTWELLFPCEDYDDLHKEVLERLILGKSLYGSKSLNISRTTTHKFLDQILKMSQRVIKTIDQSSVIRNIRYIKKVISKLDVYKQKRLNKFIVFLESLPYCGKATTTQKIYDIFNSIFDGVMNLSADNGNTLVDVNTHVFLDFEPYFKDYVGNTHNGIYHFGFRAKNSIITVGDFVEYKLNDDDKKIVLKIIYIREIDDKKYLHGQMAVYGIDTILEETGPADHVYMIKKCFDVLCNSDMEKISKVIDTNLTYDEEKMRFEKLRQIDPLVNYQKGEPRSCQLCLNRCRDEDVPFLNNMLPPNEQTLTASSRFRWGSVTFNKETIKLGCTILMKSGTFKVKNYNKKIDSNAIRNVNMKIYTEYGRKSSIINKCTPKPCQIGYVEEIISTNLLSLHDIQLKVFLLKRPENIEPHDLKPQINQVYWTNICKMINLSDVISLCEVSYFKDITTCSINWSIRNHKRFLISNCKSKYLDSMPLKVQKELTILDEAPEEHTEVLKSMDIFCGCGGLSEGLRQSGVVKPHWAIENDSAAAESFKSNHKNCSVFIENANFLLEDIISNNYNKRYNIPKPGEVDIICAGPPCQGFSVLNQFSDMDCSSFTNSLVPTTLSYCDYFRPRYFIMENVTNLARYKNGLMLKFIMKSLLDMDYQLTLGVLQAGNYGVPQTRSRLFIIAAEQNETLPQLPRATHSFGFEAINLNINGKHFQYGNLGTAPRNAVTVGDAIMDLPVVENGNMQRLLGYAHPPSTEFQMLMRRDSGSLVKDHIVKKLTPLNLLRISLVPKDSCGDWRDLPNVDIKLDNGLTVKKLMYSHKDKKRNIMLVCHCKTPIKNCKSRQSGTLIPWYLAHTGDKNNNWAGVLGRVDRHGYFKATLTNPNILGKQGRVIHPTQNRVLSVREYARSQGFPDNYNFCGDIDEKYKQIGNAVAPPVAYAIGFEIKKCLKKIVLEVDGRTSDIATMPKCS